MFAASLLPTMVKLVLVDQVSPVRLLETGEKCADVRGINNHTVTNLPISTVAGVVHNQHGQ